MTHRIKISLIRQDGGTQAREKMNPEVIKEYSASMSEGAEFPPVVLFHDGSTYWLGDGFHRVAAAIEAKQKTIAAEVHDGGFRDAILYAVGANASHGIRRTNADKRRSVSRLLDDQEWSQWSDREIARRCGVSNPFVSQMRSERVLTVNTQGAPGVLTVSTPKAKPEPVQPPCDDHGTEPITTAEQVRELGRKAALEAPPEPKPKPEAPKVDSEEVAKLQAKVKELEETNAQALALIDEMKLDLEAAHRILDAEGMFEQFQKEIHRAHALATSYQTRNNGLMNHNKVLALDCKRLMNRVGRLEKKAAGEVVELEAEQAPPPDDDPNWFTREGEGA